MVSTSVCCIFLFLGGGVSSTANVNSIDAAADDSVTLSEDVASVTSLVPDKPVTKAEVLYTSNLHCDHPANNRRGMQSRNR